MAKIQFDPELMWHIKTIYGNADLDGRTIKQLYQVWKTNPQFIINAYNQKVGISSKTKLAPKAQLNPGQINKPEIADDDLSGITNFIDAFRIANKKGLKQFKWKSTKANPSGIISFGKKPSKQKDGQSQKGEQGQKSTKANPSGLFKVESKTNKQISTQPATSSTQRKRIMSKEYYKNMIDKGFTWDSKKQMWNNPPKMSIQTIQSNPISRNTSTNTPNSVQATVTRYNTQNTIGGNFGIGKGIKNTISSFLNWINAESGSSSNNRNRNINIYGKYQQGGTMQQQPSQEQELQKAFIQFLVQDAAAQGVQIQSEQDLQNYAQQLGEEGIKAKYQKFMQRMQGGVMAKLGTKLEYIKKLKGICPEGYELTYFKVGGRICSACQKAQKGKKVDATKNFKKDMKNKDEASRDSIAINKWQDQETMAKKGDKGNFKKGIWIPDRKKYKK